MLTSNIDLKNFKTKKNTQKIKKKLKKLLQENNEIIRSLRKTYKNSYNKKLVNKYNKGLNYNIELGNDNIIFTIFYIIYCNIKNLVNLNCFQINIF